MTQAAARTDKILVVDDDARIRDLLRRYLTQEGFEVILAEDGKADRKLLPSIPTERLLLMYRTMVRSRRLEATMERILRYGNYGTRNVRFAPSYFDTIYVGAFSPYPLAHITTDCPTIRLYGIDLGTDKPGHIFQQGYEYYNSYEDARAGGAVRARDRRLRRDRGLGGRRCRGREPRRPNRSSGGRARRGRGRQGAAGPSRQVRGSGVVRGAAPLHVALDPGAGPTPKMPGARLGGDGHLRYGHGHTEHRDKPDGRLVCRS